MTIKCRADHRSNLKRLRRQTGGLIIIQELQSGKSTEKFPFESEYVPFVRDEATRAVKEMGGSRRPFVQRLEAELHGQLHGTRRTGGIIELPEGRVIPPAPAGIEVVEGFAIK